MDFTQLFNDPSSSDITIILQSERLALHKIFLGFKSKVMRTLLQDCAGSVLDLSSSPFQSGLKPLFRHVYTGQLQIEDCLLGVCWAAVHHFDFDDQGLVHCQLKQQLPHYSTDDFNANAQWILQHEEQPYAQDLLMLVYSQIEERIVRENKFVHGLSYLSPQSWVEITKHMKSVPEDLLIILLAELGSQSPLVKDLQSRITEISQKYLWELSKQAIETQDEHLSTVVKSYIQNHFTEIDDQVLGKLPFEFVSFAMIMHMKKLCLLQKIIPMFSLRPKEATKKSFPGLDFSSLNLDFSKADFSGWDLQYSTFSGCFLEGSSFSGCNLKGVNFSGCNLKASNFSECNLEGVNFSGCDLQNSNLCKARLDRLNLNDPNFFDCNLEGVNFSGCDLRNSNLCKAKFGGLSFYACNLQDSDFSKALLQGVRLEHANLSRGNFSGAILSGGCLASTILTKTNFTNTDLGSGICPREVMKAMKDGAIFNGATLKGYRFPDSRGYFRKCAECGKNDMHMCPIEKRQYQKRCSVCGEEKSSFSDYDGEWKHRCLCYGSYVF